MASDEFSDMRTTEGPEADARLLEHLVGEYIDRVNNGEKIDPAEIIDAHPDLAAAILRELDTFQGIMANGPTSPSLGTLGDYTLRRQIGRGGMGVVYEAWQGSLDRQVALKVLPAGVAADTRSYSRFLREAQIAAKINHPHVVGVHGFGVEENTPYYAMLTGQSPRTSPRS